MKFNITKEGMLWSILYALATTGVIISTLGKNNKLSINKPKIFNILLVSSVIFLIAITIALVVRYFFKNRMNSRLKNKGQRTIPMTKEVDKKQTPVIYEISEATYNRNRMNSRLKNKGQRTIPMTKEVDKKQTPVIYEISEATYNRNRMNSRLKNKGQRTIPMTKEVDKKQTPVIYEISEATYNRIVKNTGNLEITAHISEVIINCSGNNRFYTMRMQYEFFRRFIMESRVFVNLETSRIKILAEEEKVRFLDKIGEHLKLKAIPGKPLVNLDINKVQSEFLKVPTLFCDPRGKSFLNPGIASILMTSTDSTVFLRDEEFFDNVIRDPILRALKCNNLQELAKNFITKLARDEICLQFVNTLEIKNLTLVRQNIIAENIALFFGAFYHDAENVNVEFVEECTALLKSSPTPQKMLLEEQIYETIRAIKAERLDGSFERDKSYLSKVANAKFMTPDNVYAVLRSITGFVSSSMIIKYLHQIHNKGNLIVEAYDTEPDGNGRHVTRPLGLEEKENFLVNCRRLLEKTESKLGALEMVPLSNFRFISNHKEEALQPEALFSTEAQLDYVIEKFNDKTVGFALVEETRGTTQLPKSRDLLKRLIENIVLCDNNLDDKAKLALVEQTYIKLRFVLESGMTQEAKSPKTTMIKSISNLELNNTHPY